MVRSQLVVLLAILAASVGCGGAGNGNGNGGGARACTDIGCANGFVLEFSYRDRGAYVFELVVDGVSVTCNATIPLARDVTSACSSSAAQLGLVGSMLPESQQSIGGLTFFGLPTTVTVKASRDDTTLVDTIVTPTYLVTPGPNGPGCEPKECRSATVSLSR